MKNIFVLVMLAMLAIAAGPVKVPVKLLDTGAGEGPAWHPEKGLFFTGGGKITQRDRNGKVSVYREAAGGANGLLWDHQGRLVICEAANRRVTRLEKDGTLTVLADRYEGKRFNSPNDLTTDSQGRIYFSDPRYGKRDDMELSEGVYRIDAPGQVVRVLDREVDRPNGVLVSATGKDRDRYLYVADNNNNTPSGARKLWRFDLNKDGSVNKPTRKRIFDWENSRGPDGLKEDLEGRLYVAGGLNGRNAHESPDKYRGGVFVLSPAGKLERFIPIPVDEVTNVAFGGPDWKTLFITAGGTLWSVELPVPGRAPLHLLRK